MFFMRLIFPDFFCISEKNIWEKEREEISRGNAPIIGRFARPLKTLLIYISATPVFRAPTVIWNRSDVNH